jgi:hypothetical protein
MIPAENAEKLVQQCHNLLSQPEIVIPNIDKNNPEDQILALQVALRGKTTEEYESIVDGLFERAHLEEDEELKAELNELIGHIMAIGEDRLGIDWA